MQRSCPICNRIRFYKSVVNFELAKEKNTPCNSCVYKEKFQQSGKIEKFIKLIEEGYFRPEIIKILDITNGKYSNLIKVLKLKSNKETAIKIVDKINNLAQCSKCKRILPLEENFFLKKKKTGYTFYQTYCYDCHYKKRNDYINSDINVFLSERYFHIKHAQNRKKYIFNISKEDLIEQYNLQKGLCFYTDLPMICLYGHGKQRDAISVDRIIPELGYVKGNIVFCLNRINMAKHDFSLEEIKKWMPDWHARIERFMKNE